MALDLEEALENASLRCVATFTNYPGVVSLRRALIEENLDATNN